METLSSSAVLVLHTIGLHLDREGKCWPSVRRISALSRLSRRTVQRSIRRLESGGLLRTERRLTKRYGYGSNLYRTKRPREILFGPSLTPPMRHHDAQNRSGELFLPKTLPPLLPSSGARTADPLRMARRWFRDGASPAQVDRAIERLRRESGASEDQLKAFFRWQYKHRDLRGLRVPIEVVTRLSEYLEWASKQANAAPQPAPSASLSAGRPSAWYRYVGRPQ